MKYEKDHAVSGVFVFLLLGIFAALSLVLVLFCARAYHGMVEQTDAHNTQRVLNSFIRNVVRSNDADDVFCLRDFDGIDTLCISAPEDEGEYVQYIYLYDGMIRALYTETAYEFAPDEGEEICAASALSFTLEGNLLTAHCTDAEGESSDVLIALRAPKGGTL